MAHRWQVLGVTALAIFMVFLDTTIVNIAFPSIHRLTTHHEGATP